jgi:hypothetical protein
MKSLLTMILAISAAVAGAQTTGQGQIRHVETSMNHLTVLEFGEPVTTLAVGDGDSFQIERHEDKVFIKPLQQGVSTNLFVWTASRELSYELDPSGSLSSMDVLIRTDPAPNPRRALRCPTNRAGDSQNSDIGSHSDARGSGRHYTGIEQG